MARGSTRSPRSSDRPISRTPSPMFTRYHAGMPKRPLTCLLYCRLSRRPDDGKTMTVAEQEKLLRAEADRRGLEVLGSHVDDGVSAFSRAKRPGFGDLV